MSDSSLSGVGTALVTPFTNDGAIDEIALRDLVEWQIGEGINFLVPCGSTGEAQTLSSAEQQRVVAIVAEQTRGRVPVCAGASSNDTARAIAASREMQAAGATHLLHASPAYSRPPQRGILAHFRAIADAVDLPIVVYNVPGRTASNVEPATTLALAEHPRIVAVKEASGNLAQITEILRARPSRFGVFSGDDSLTFPLMMAGGDGIISVISNAAPALMVRLADACRAGDVARARELHMRLVPWMTAAFVESNPIPVKAALAMMGRMSNVLRLPLVPLDPRHTATVRAALVDVGVLDT